MRKKNLIRYISDLRIQYFCEYRYYLKSTEEDRSTPASIRGEWLHSRVGIGISKESVKQNPLLVILIIVILLILIVWMFW